MDNSKFKLAMGQMLVEGGEAKANLDRATKMIENAADKGCSVIVLPECMDLGWANPAARDLATAALALECVRGTGLAAAARVANAAGALACLKLGAQPSMPTAAEVAEFLKGR